jgi:hypothetical protein
MIKPPKKKLGKGLSALLGNGTSPINGLNPQKPLSNAAVAAVEQVSAIEKIYPGRFQPRQQH